MRDGMATRERLRQVALALFVARGVDAVSVRDITAAADVRAGTLYVHWPSKDALIEDLFRTGFDRYGEQIATVLTAPGDFAARLAALVALVCRIHDEDETLFAFLLLTQHRNLAAVPGGATHPIRVIHDAVAAALARGEIAAGDPVLLTATILGTLVHAATFRLYGWTDRAMVAMAPELTRLCLRTLGLEEDAA
jgi:AcrR family transcriptional regulator